MELYKNKNGKKSSISHVILTGGVGSRLWPSRKSRPKQYLDI
jgi:mannose-1-phosphate guanylyltransferase